MSASRSISSEENQHTAFDRAVALVGAGAGVRSVATAITTVAAFSTMVLLVRLLGTSFYGALAFGMSIVGLAGALILGFGLAVTRTLAASFALGDLDAARDATRGASTVVVAVGGIGLVVVLAAVILTQDQLDSAQAVALGLGLGLLLVGRTAAFTAEAVARGSGRLLMMELPALFGVLSQLTVAGVLTILGIVGVEAVATGYGIVGVLTVIIAAAVTHRIFAGSSEAIRPDTAAALRLLRIAGPFVVAGVAVRLIASFDVFILGATHPGGPVGSYAPTLTLVEALVIVAPMMLMALFITAASELSVTGDSEGFSRLYVTVSKLSVAVAMPAFLLVLSAPVEVLQFAFGERFPATPTISRLLLIGFFVNVASGANAQALLASGERRGLVRTFLWPIFAMAGSSLALIPHFGAIGAAMATTVAVIVLNAAVSWTLYRRTGVHPFHRDLVLVVVSAPLAILGTFAIDRALGPGVWAAGLASLLAWCLWILCMKALGALQFAELRGFLPRRSRSR